MVQSARIVVLFLVSLFLISCGSSGGSSAPSASSVPLDVVDLQGPAKDAVLLSTDIELTWNPSEEQGETRWGLTIYTTTEGTKQTVLTHVAEETSYRPTQLAENRTYTWKVEALDDDDDTVAVSEEWAFHTYHTRMLPFAGALDQGSYPDEFTGFDGAVYFTAYSPEYGWELWRKRGADDAEPVSDSIRAGDKGSGPRELTVCGDLLYFTADDGVHGRELWVLDLTDPAAEPVMKEIITDENEGSDPSALVAVGDALYFSARGAVDAEETLWRLAGKDSEPEPVTRTASDEHLFYPHQGIAHDGALYVSALAEGSDERVLWRVDGTVGSRPVIIGGGASTDPKGFVVYDGILYFRATSGEAGTELWRVDADGNQSLFKDIIPGAGSSSPGELTEAGDLLFFTADTTAHGRELWMSDGSPEGTTLVKDILLGSLGSQPRNLTDSAGTLYFIAKTTDQGFELWKSDGTEGGTSLVRDIREGSADSAVDELVAFEGGVLFRAEEGEAGKELWFSGGEAGNTFRVKDIQVGETGSYPDGLASLNGTLWFRADDGLGGVELWQSEGSDATTLRTDNLNPYLDPNMDGAVRVGNSLLMVATSGEYGRELFIIDDNGCVSILSDIYEGYLGSEPENLFVHESRLFFAAEDGKRGKELWVTDGTLGNTRRVRDVNPGSESSNPGFFSVFNSKVYFLAQVGGQWQLWETDGTHEGTSAVYDAADQPVVVGTFDDTLALAAGDARLFFRKGDELWAMDSEGTMAVVTGVKQPSELFPVSASLLFASVIDGETKPCLHILLPEETQVDAPLQCNAGKLYEPHGFYRTGDTIFFSAIREGETERSLFRFVIASGKVNPINDSAGSPLLQPEDFCGEDGLLWFTAGAASGREICQLQAGAVTARNLSSFATGVTAETPASLRPVGDALYYIANDPSTGKSCLYMCRGSIAGPTLDFNGRPLLGAKNAFALDGYLFLTANNPDSGTHHYTQGLWVTSPPSF